MPQCRINVIAALALAAAVALAPSAGAGGSRDRCAAKGSKTDKSTAQVRVYTIERGQTTRYYGCLRSTGRRIRLLDSVDDPDFATGTSVIDVRVAGTTVLTRATGFEEIGPEGEEYEQLLVVDLRRLSHHYFIQIDTDQDSRYTGFTGLILRADGTAAWITTGQGDYDEIDVLPPRADLPSSVAYAKGIDEKSLRFGGDGVTWRQNGETRTAPIP